MAAFIATSDDAELAKLGSEMAGILEKHAATGVTCHYGAFPTESHATIYHPAALLAFRTMFAPAPVKQ